MTALPTGLLLQPEPLVGRVLAPNASPYTGTGTQTHLIGTRDLAVVDPGPDDSAHLAALLAAIDGRPVRAILVTHHHRDHSPLASRLQQATGAPIMGSAPFSRAPSNSFDPDYVPDHVLAEGDTVTGDGWTLHGLHTPGHTSAHLCFALPEADAVLTGDHVMGWSTSVVIPPDGAMGEYLASLERMQARDDRIYYPAHGDPVTDPQRLLRGTIGHRRQREAQLLRLLGDGPAGADALTQQSYPALDRKLLPAARATVTAHLLELARREAVREEEGVWTLA